VCVCDGCLLKSVFHVFSLFQKSQIQLQNRWSAPAVMKVKIRRLWEKNSPVPVMQYACRARRWSTLFLMRKWSLFLNQMIPQCLRKQLPSLLLPSLPPTPASRPASRPASKPTAKPTAKPAAKPAKVASICCKRS